MKKNTIKNISLILGFTLLIVSIITFKNFECNDVIGVASACRFPKEVLIEFISSLILIIYGFIKRK